MHPYNTMHLEKKQTTILVMFNLKMGLLIQEHLSVEPLLQFHENLLQLRLPATSPSQRQSI